MLSAMLMKKAQPEPAAAAAAEEEVRARPHRTRCLLATAHRLLVRRGRGATSGTMGKTKVAMMTTVAAAAAMRTGERAAGWR